MQVNFESCDTWFELFNTYETELKVYAKPGDVIIVEGKEHNLLKYYEQILLLIAGVTAENVDAAEFPDHLAVLGMAVEAIGDMSSVDFLNFLKERLSSMRLEIDGLDSQYRASWRTADRSRSGPEVITPEKVEELEAACEVIGCSRQEWG